VSSTCLIRHDRVLYSVPAQWVGKIVSVRVSAYSIRIVAESKIIAEHQRCFKRDQIICNPWHYLSVLEKKPGALRHGIPFQDWDLPAAIQQVRKRLVQQEKGDKAFVDCLLLAKEVGLDAFETACELTLDEGVVTGSIILNEMRRLTEENAPKEMNAGEHLALSVEPTADTQCYDHLLGVHNVH